MNITKKKIETSIKENDLIPCVRHFRSPMTEENYLLSSCEDNSITVRKCEENYNIHTKISDCHQSNNLYSCLIVFDPLESKNYILTSTGGNESIKVFNFKDGIFLNEFGITINFTYTMNSYYNKCKKTLY